MWTLRITRKVGHTVYVRATGSTTKDVTTMVLHGSGAAELLADLMLSKERFEILDLTTSKRRQTELWPEADAWRDDPAA